MKGKVFRIWILIFTTLLLVVGIMLWKTSQLRKGSCYELYAIFENVAGLRPGSEVRFRGKSIGRVETVSAMMSNVKVGFTVDMKQKIPSGCSAKICFDGLIGIGDRYLEIIPPTPTMISDSVLPAGSVLIGEKPVTLDELQKLASSVLVKLGSAIDSLDKKINAFDPATINQTMRELQSLGQNLNQAVTEFRQLETKGLVIFDSLEVLSGRLGRMADDIRVVTADTTFRNDLKQSIENLRKTTSALRKIFFWSR